MSASLFLEFMFKKKELPWQTENYQLLNPANAEADVYLHTGVLFLKVGQWPSCCPAGIPHSLCMENPLVFPLVHPGETFKEHHKPPPVTELLEIVFP